MDLDIFFETQKEQKTQKGFHKRFFLKRKSKHFLVFGKYWFLELTHKKVNGMTD